MMIWPILILAGLVALVVFAVRALSGGPGGRTGGQSARQVLDERYARGEVTDEEYRRRRQSLE